MTFNPYHPTARVDPIARMDPIAPMVVVQMLVLILMVRKGWKKSLRVRCALLPQMPANKSETNTSPQDIWHSDLGAGPVFRVGVGVMVILGRITAMIQWQFSRGTMDFWDPRTIALMRILLQNGLAKHLSFV